MAHDTGAGVHSEKGGEGVAMAWSHKYARQAAEVVSKLPFAVSLVKSLDPTGGKLTGGGIRTALGYFNLPIPGVWGARINAVFDAFGYEVAEILEKNADKTVEEILQDDALMGQLNAKAEDFFGKKAWLVLEQVHADKECTIFQALSASESYRDKEGKEHKKPGRHAIVELSLASAIKQKCNFCPKCFPTGSPAGESAAKSKEPVKQKASPADICGQYVLEAADDEERRKRADRVEWMWKLHANVMDPELSDRLDGLNTRAELETLLLAADKDDQAAFNAALMRLEEPGLGRSASKAARQVRRAVDDRLQKLDAACVPMIEDLNREIAVLKARREMKKKPTGKKESFIGRYFKLLFG